MLRAVLEHPKFRKLCSSLGVGRYQAAGLLECLWQFTARYAPRGDIGKFTDEEIAQWLEYPDPAGLIWSLVDARWLNRSAKYRLVVHDWHDHADRNTKRALERKKIGFASEENGSPLPPNGNPRPPEGGRPEVGVGSEVGTGGGNGPAAPPAATTPTSHPPENQETEEAEAPALERVEAIGDIPLKVVAHFNGFALRLGFNPVAIRQRLREYTRATCWILLAYMHVTQKRRNPGKQKGGAAAYLQGCLKKGEEPPNWAAKKAQEELDGLDPQGAKAAPAPGVDQLAATALKAPEGLDIARKKAEWAEAAREEAKSVGEMW